MRTVSFGAEDRQVPIIGQGTWYIEQGPRDKAIGALRHGLDIGLTHIDTAEMYASGAAEDIVGEAIAGRRDEAFLVSKVLPSHASYNGTIQACEDTLERLGTDRLDCYLLHWRGSYPLEETFRAMDELVEGGKILSYGVSNFDTDDLEEASGLLGGPEKIACNQALYHLGERYAEHGVIPWCRENGVAFVAYSPFGQNDFPSRGAGRDVLDQVAARHGASARQIALSFLARDDGVLLIPKASQVAHLDDNRGAADLTLNADDIAAIDAVFPK